MLARERFEQQRGRLIVADISNLGGSKSIRNQVVFLDGKMRELDNFRTLVLDDGDESGTRGEHSFLWVFRSPALNAPLDHDVDTGLADGFLWFG